MSQDDVKAFLKENPGYHRASVIAASLKTDVRNTLADLANLKKWGEVEQQTVTKAMREYRLKE